MPTPSPSMVARVGATTGMSAKWPSSPMSPRPVTSATMAVMMGMPAATSAPKVIARITTPAARPIISLRRDLSSESLTPSTPPASTCRPASRAGWAAAMTSLASSRVTRPPSTSISTWAMAVFSSSLMSRSRAPRANGLVTLVTCGTALIRRTDSWTARLAAGSSSVPSAEWNTTGLWPFCCGGNSLARKSVAAWVSVPGSVMSLDVRAPSSTHPEPTATTTTAHTSSTTHQRRAQKDPSL